MTPAQLAKAVAALAVLAGLLGFTLVPAAPGTPPVTTPPVVTAPPVVTVPPVVAQPPIVTTPSAGGCTTPTGMKALLDQDMEDDQSPWRRPAGQQRTVINFVPDGSVTSEWRGFLSYGTGQWNKSPCLDTRIVGSCPSGGNCVKVVVVKKGDDGNFDATEKSGFTTGGEIQLNASLSTAEKTNVAVHEMGHAVGLRHVKTKHVLMDPDTLDDVFDPSPTDYKNLLFMYGRQLQP